MTQAPPPSPRAARPFHAQSFLVRVWTESPQAANDPPLRAYVRNLRSGEESYAKDSSELAACLGWEVDAAQRDRATAPGPRNGTRQRATSD